MSHRTGKTRAARRRLGPGPGEPVRPSGAPGFFAGLGFSLQPKGFERALFDFLLPGRIEQAGRSLRAKVQEITTLKMRRQKLIPPGGTEPTLGGTALSPDRPQGSFEERLSSFKEDAIRRQTRSRRRRRLGRPLDEPLESRRFLGSVRL